MRSECTGVGGRPSFNVESGSSLLLLLLLGGAQLEADKSRVTRRAAGVCFLLRVPRANLTAKSAESRYDFIHSIPFLSLSLLLLSGRNSNNLLPSNFCQL